MSSKALNPSPPARLGYGTASLHHTFSTSRRVRLLEHAHAHGCHHVDTSPLYGDGLAEADIGKTSTHFRQTATIATKIGLYPSRGTAKTALGLWARRGLDRLVGRRARPTVGFALSQANSSFYESLRRMKVDRVQTLFLHEPSWPLDDLERIQEWLYDIRDRGLISRWGIAGRRASLEPFVRSHHPIAESIQTFDTAEGREADFLTNYSRSPDLTYGYLRGCLDPEASIRFALSERRAPVILISSQSVERLTWAAKIAAHYS